MKRILTTAAILLTVACFSLSGQIKNAGCYLRMVEPENEALTYENEQIQIDFEFSSYNYFCDVTFRNKTDKVLTIDWDKCAVIIEEESDRIIFDDTRMINKDALGTATLVPGSKITKAIASQQRIELEMEYYTKGWVKKRGTQYIGFFFPVTAEDGTTTNCQCKISVSLQ